MTNKDKALEFITLKDTKFARTDQEKAKYLVAVVLPSDMPHPATWNAVLKIANGL